MADLNRYRERDSERICRTILRILSDLKTSGLVLEIRYFKNVHNLKKQVVTTKADRLFKSVLLRCLINVHYSKDFLKMLTQIGINPS